MGTMNHHHRDHPAPGRVLVVDPALGEQALTELHGFSDLGLVPTVNLRRVADAGLRARRRGGPGFSSVLADNPHCTLSPHAAGMTRSAMRAASHRLLEQFAHFVEEAGLVRGGAAPGELR
ncbi:hypothetical protein [Streptomyces sp. NPDC059828]|uniref:hypothetical protein n=1 Tax=Streptomyces sp. NPDC059828 TaxID=3346965 RepID=UPI003668A2E5